LAQGCNFGSRSISCPSIVPLRLMPNANTIRNPAVKMVISDCDGDDAPDEPQAVQCLAFGGRLLCQAVGSRVQVRKSDTGVKLHTLKGHEGTVTCLAADDRDGSLFSGSVDGTTKKWAVESGSLLLTLEGHSSLITCLAICEREGAVFTGSGDRTVKKWDTGTGACLATLQGHRLLVTCLGIYEHEGTVFSGSGDTTVKKWSAKTGELLATLQGHQLPIAGLEVRAKEGVLLSGEWGGHSLKKWDLTTGASVDAGSGPPPVTAVLI